MNKYFLVLPKYLVQRHPWRFNYNVNHSLLHRSFHLNGLEIKDVMNATCIVFLFDFDDI